MKRGRRKLVARSGSGSIVSAIARPGTAACVARWPSDWDDWQCQGYGFLLIATFFLAAFFLAVLWGVLGVVLAA